MSSTHHDQSTSQETSESMVEESKSDSWNESPKEHATDGREQDQEGNSSDDKLEENATDQTLGWPRLLIIAFGLWFSVFLYSVDQTIVSNAIPAITDEFHSQLDEGWFSIAGYLLTTSAFQLLYGRIYSNFSIKYTLLTSIFIFELGSLICGVAPTSNALIAGRAIAGVGCAGIAAGAYIVIGNIFPLHIRPIFISSMAIVFAIAAVLGPVLGGIFTTDLTWRWCFYINLPFGGVAMAGLLFFLPPLTRPELASLRVTERLRKLDVIGALIFIPAIVCLLLALEWGGTTYAWSNGRIIALFVVFGVLGIAFIAFEFWKGDEATMPARIITQRSVAAAAWNAFCNGAAFFLLVYYIPEWQQVILNESAASSGINLLPFVLGVVIMAILVGFLVMRVGYFTPFMLLSTLITPIGEGLMTTWTVNTSFSHRVGYQALAGLGMGMGQQQPQVAIQTVLPKTDIPVGVSIVMLLQTLSGAIFVSVGQAVLQSRLTKNLESAFPTGAVNATSLSTVGVTQVRAQVPVSDLPTVLVAYNNAFREVFIVALCMSCLTIVGSLSMEWKSVKKARQQVAQEKSDSA